MRQLSNFLTSETSPDGAGVENPFDDSVFEIGSCTSVLDVNTHQAVGAVAGGQARDGDVGAVLGRRRLLQPVVLALVHGHAAPLVVLRLRPARTQ